MLRKHCPIPLPELRRRYQAGELVRDLAAAFGVSTAPVSRWLHEAGAVMRTGHPERKSIDLDRVRQWAALGWSCRDMAAAIGGCHEETVREAMVANGIPRRRFHGGARPERNYFWGGGRIVDKSGYILVKMDDHPHATATGYVREHRLVMEEVLGRFLDPREVVHHRDGNRSNNVPDNLELFASNADHLRSELTGKCPRWTEDGKARIREGIRQAKLRRDATRQASETGGAQ